MDSDHSDPRLAALVESEGGWRALGYRRGQVNNPLASGIFTRGVIGAFRPARGFD
jgi:hypothetical protein